MNPLGFIISGTPENMNPLGFIISGTPETMKPPRYALPELRKP
jgi:hypothetical protein